MKKYKVIFFAMLCVFLAGLVLCAAAAFHETKSGDEVVLLNDIVHNALLHTDSPDELAELDFGADYLIFDSRENILYSSAAADISSLGEAIKNHYPYMMMVQDDRVIGSAVLLVSPYDSIRTQKRQIFRIVLLTELGILICVVALWIFVRKNIVVPFGKMEDFAGEVAAGNLDVPLEMDKENVFGVFTESFDIMREELAAARDREILMKKREKELIATLSHDIRTPVTGIRLTAELMQAQSTEPSVLEKLGNIRKNADQIDALVGDLFTSALKDLGEMKVTPTEETSEILNEILKRCDDRALVNSTPVPEGIIRVDRRRMEQVIRNIISNSYKYAGTKIDVTCSAEGKFLKMSVRDYGKGVPDDELMLLTNKFYRSRVSAGSGIEGSGLGLYIANELMTEMGGNMRCLNASPGFEVRLSIPLA